MFLEHSIRSFSLVFQILVLSLTLTNSLSVLHPAAFSVHTVFHLSLSNGGGTEL